MQAMIINYILFAVFVALQCGDAWTTINVIKSGKGHEANPIMAWLFDKIGMYLGFVVAKSATILAIGFIVYIAPELAATLALVVFNLLYGYVVYQNYRILKL